MKKKISAILELFKIRITLFVAVTTGFGYLLFSGRFDLGMALSSVGILLLAFSSAALNHIQERKTDAMMNRTKGRPLPSGRIKTLEAVLYAVLAFAAGTLILLLFFSPFVFIAGLTCLIWYNLIYTPMKKINSLAIIPGSVIGALPPVAGWLAAGGGLFDPQVMLIAFFFFIWQIPHFWLLLLIFNNDYEQAGFPTLIGLFNDKQLARITFVWTSVSALSVLLFPIFKVTAISFFSFILPVLALWLMLSASTLLKKDLSRLSFNIIFRRINYFALLVIIFVSIDKVLLN
ncbi:MAG: protoheme IX farnesyltransferase [Ignavibacteriaceae bacterium]|nr:protoheme IX farnesyltransferase [Ignavibacteriaceae bacterium]